VSCAIHMHVANVRFSFIFYSNMYLTRCNVTQFILSKNCSECFGWYLHLLSGAQTTVCTAFGICHTVLLPDAVDTVVSAPNDGRRCHPKHRAVSRWNKLCNVASCWIYIRILLRCKGPGRLNFHLSWHL